MALGVTIRATAERFDRHGLIGAAEALGRLDDVDPDEDLEWFGWTLGEAVLGMLVEIRVAVVLTRDKVLVEDAYRDALDELAACTGGAVTVTDVRLHEESDLRFRLDGADVEWPVDPSDRYIDHLTFVERVPELTPDGSRRWSMLLDEETYETYFVFGEPDALRALARDCDLDLDVYE